MAKEIDLLAGTKRQSPYSEALLRSALSGKPAYCGRGSYRPCSDGRHRWSCRKSGQQGKRQGLGRACRCVRCLAAVARKCRPMPNAPTAAAPRSVPVGADVVSEAATPQDYINRGFGMTPQGRDIATRTVLGEAANQGELGMQAVADVMKNRADAGGYRTGSTGPTTMDRVATAPGQFEPHMTAQGRARMAGYSPNSPAYQTAQSAVDNASIGGTPDVTGGSTHFYFPSVNAQLAAQDGRKAVPRLGGWPSNRLRPSARISSSDPDQARQAYAQGPQNTQTDAIVEMIKNPRTSNEMRARLLQMLQRPQAYAGKAQG